MNYRQAFTLMEILVVITIIAVLASIAIPTIGLVKRALKDMQCSHNLQQIGVALETFKQTHDGQFPFCLSSRFNPSDSSQSVTSLTRQNETMVGQKSLFVCPRDPDAGHDPTKLMGRNVPPTWNDLSYLYEDGCSYLYEVNGQEVDPNLKTYFLRGLPQDQITALDTKPVTWAAAKKIQRLTGNYSSAPPGTTFGAPFPTDKFPIIRCFYHYKWAGASNLDATTVKKVKSVSWDLNVFECSPKWECDLDSRFIN